MNPFVAFSLVKRYKLDQIILLSSDEVSAKHQLPYFQSAYSFSDIKLLFDCYPTNKLHSLYRRDALLSAQRLLDNSSQSSDCLHNVIYKGARVGLYLASTIQRHNPKSCISWNISPTAYTSHLANWIYHANLVLGLIDQGFISNDSVGLFTHSCYFWGFIGELLDTRGIRSLVYGGSPTPEWRAGTAKHYSNSRNLDHILPQVHLPPLASDYMINIHNPTLIEQQLYASLHKSLDITHLNNNAAAHYAHLVKKYSSPPYRCLSIDNYTTDRFSRSYLTSENPVFCLFLHSFNDSQFSWGFDGFETLYQYYIAIVQSLSEFYPNSPILIRPHPDMFLPSKSERLDQDISISMSLIDHVFLISPSNVYLLLPEIPNSWFYNLSPYCVAVTHHSPNVAIESLLSRRLCIISRCMLKVSLDSPHLLFLDGPFTIPLVISNLVEKFPVLSKLSDQDVQRAVLLAGQYARMDPQYNYKLPIDNARPLFSLLAGFSDVHKGFAYQCESLFKQHFNSSTFDYPSFILNFYGPLVYKQMIKESARIISCA